MLVNGVVPAVSGPSYLYNAADSKTGPAGVQARDLKLELEALRRQIGKGGDELIPVFVPWWKREIVREPLKAYRKHVFQHGLREQIEAIAGVRPLLWPWGGTDAGSRAKLGAVAREPLEPVSCR